MVVKKSDGKTFVRTDGKPFVGLYFVDELTNIAYEYKEGQKPQLSNRLYTKSVYNTELVRNRLQLPAITRIPEPFIPSPTVQDYGQGIITRYFLQKRNLGAANVIEVSEQTYLKLGPPINRNTLDESSYKGVLIYWRLTGNLEYVKEFNGEQVKEASKTIPGLIKELNKLDQFYKRQ
jgi:hypothetical protein